MNIVRQYQKGRYLAIKYINNLLLEVIIDDEIHIKYDGKNIDYLENKEISDFVHDVKESINKVELEKIDISVLRKACEQIVTEDTYTYSYCPSHYVKHYKIFMIFKRQYSLRKPSHICGRATYSIRIVNNKTNTRSKTINDVLVKRNKQRFAEYYDLPEEIVDDTYNMFLQAYENFSLGEKEIDKSLCFYMGV